uniref:Uncharacterized protein n=1 Tax=Clytia hemisphaerica TaxID=252671 RepID=A0A7M5X9B4_9CNID
MTSARMMTMIISMATTIRAISHDAKPELADPEKSNRTFGSFGFIRSIDAINDSVTYTIGIQTLDWTAINPDAHKSFCYIDRWFLTNIPIYGNSSAYLTYHEK